MAQKYKKSDGFEWERSDGTKRQYPVTNKGVSIIHLFNEEWRIGRVMQKNGKEPHVVVYAPDDKQYHAYGEDALRMVAGKGGKSINKAEAKIWVLTNVLDDPDYWCRNMHEKPEEGMPVKVIFENGTIKWVDEFKGDWETHRMEIPTQIPTKENPNWKICPKTDKEKKESQFIWEDSVDIKNIVAWRIKK